jgi:Holliday junction resolvasome RuvABC ATP-dependent DNA helicase subunit
VIFKGQPLILRQLSTFLPVMQAEGINLNFLLIAPSGWGKTRLGFFIANYLVGGKFFYYEPKEGKVKLDLSRRVQFIDEVHLLQTPETLYSMMDSGQFVFILATNESGKLPEALMNRCVILMFEPYTQESLLEICQSVCPNLNDYTKIIEAGHSNPREILGILRSLNFVIKQRGCVPEIEDFLTNFLGLTGGLNTAQCRYLEALTALGGRASLKTLSAYLHLSEGIIQYHVEPGILYLGQVKITSRGRERV